MKHFTRWVRLVNMPHHDKLIPEWAASENSKYYRLMPREFWSVLRNMPISNEGHPRKIKFTVECAD